MAQRSERIVMLTWLDRGQRSHGRGTRSRRPRLRRERGGVRPIERGLTVVVHVQCPVCHEDKAVAFSCKLRGLCPNCAGRRMAGTAAQLVDGVLPAVPVRQYVLAFPYELSGLAATRPEVLRALSRIFREAR